MAKLFLSFRWEDQVLIVAFLIFAISVISGMIITSRVEIFMRYVRLMSSLADKFSKWTEALRDVVVYDPEWMDAKKWEEANRP